MSRLIQGLASGLVIGLLEIILAVSFAALIFTGPLTPFVASGIGLALAGATLSGFTIAALTSLPGTVSGNQEIPVAIMAVTATAIVGNMPDEASARETMVTVVITIALTTILTGLFFYGLGRFQLGGLIRFLPYPVLGGFLAGTGWLLIVGAMGTMLDVPPALSTLPSLFEPERLLRWLPGVALASAILVVQKRTKQPVALPGLLASAVALFYVIVALSGNNVATMADGNWLLGPFPSGRLWPAVSLAELGDVSWPAVASQAANIAAIWLMSAIALLLNASSLELVTDEDVDLDQELQAAGLGNLAAGLSGGLVGFQQLSLSAMNHKFGLSTRLPAYVAATLCLLVIFLGGSVLSLFPKVILGGLLLFLGLSFVIEWTVQSWRTFPTADYLIVILILFVTAVAGFLEAVGVGLLVAVILFVVNYSRIDVVRDEHSGARLQSRVSWRPAQRELLEAHAEQLHILRLQGYIFFGTADRLHDKIRLRMEVADPPMRYLILDFNRVTGIDLTTLSTFRRICRLADSRRVLLVFSGPSTTIRRQFAAGGVLAEGAPIFPDLDHACEWCEQQLLASLGQKPFRESAPLHEELQRVLGSESIIAELLSYFHREELAPGDYLMQQGESSDALYLLESGQVTAHLETTPGDVTRLQKMEGGHVLGELGFFLGTRRSASIIADTPVVVHRLTYDRLERMRAQDPDIASAFQRLLIHLLSERVVHLMKAVNTLKA